MTGRRRASSAVPLVVRWASALGGRTPAAAGEAGWSLAGAWSERPLRRIARALAWCGTVGGSRLDRAVACWTARPALVLGALVLLLPLTVALLPGTGVVPLVLALAGIGALLAAGDVLHAGPERRWVRRAILAGVGLRLLLGVAIHLTGGFPDEHGYYHPLAAHAASFWHDGLPSDLAGHPVVENRAGWFYLLGATYLVTEPVMVVGRVLGGLIGLAAALVAGELARCWSGPRAAALAVVILALHPEHAFWSTTLARDSASTLLALTALVVMARHPGTLLRGRLILVAVPVALLSMNAFLVAGAIAGTVVLVVTAEALTGGRPGPARVLRIALAGSLAIAALAFVGHRWGNLFTPELFTAVRQNTIGTQADFLPDLRLEHFGHVLAFLPVGAAFVLGAPFPWNAVHLHRVAYGLGALPGLAVTLTGLVGMLQAARTRPASVAPSIVFVLLLLAVFALLEGTTGIVLRHRLPITGVLAVGAACLLARVRGAAAA